MRSVGFSIFLGRLQSLCGGSGSGGSGGLTTARGARFHVWHMSLAVCVVVFGSSEKETYSWFMDMSEKKRRIGLAFGRKS